MKRKLLAGLLFTVSLSAASEQHFWMTSHAANIEDLTKTNYGVTIWASSDAGPEVVAFRITLKVKDAAGWDTTMSATVARQFGILPLATVWYFNAFDSPNFVVTSIEVKELTR